VKKITLHGEHSIEITRNKEGVSKIVTQSEKDLYLAMGYCHAMDRGLQMLLMRVLGLGKASEYLDSSDKMLEIDLFFRKLNLFQNIEAEIAKLTNEEKAFCEAYCDGVNIFISKKYPWEFKLVKYVPEPWKVSDSILISRMMGYLTLAQSEYEIERFFIQLVQNDISEPLLKEIFPKLITNIDLALLKKVKISEKIVPDAIKWNSGLPKMMASNNWVVSGKKTKSGKPILSNDPHLETNRLPNVWYEIIAKFKDNYAISATVPGLPAFLLTRTKDLAWGATYTFMDSVDSWIEDCKEGKYLKDGLWHKFKVRKEFIKRKNKPSQEVVFYENEHGVLDGNPFETGYYLTTSWSATYSGAKSLSSAFKMFNAKTVEEGMNNLGQLETSWNWVLADSQGNIGYQMSGLLPKRNSENLGFVPMLGWESKNDWQGFESFEKLPRIINPEENFFVTANNDLNSFGIAKPINICMSDYRANQITSLLKVKNDLTVEDMFKIQNDVYSIQAEKFMKIFLPLLPNNEKATILRNWDYKYNIESEGAYLFEEIYKALLVEVFGTHLNTKVTNYLLAETGIFIDFYENFDRVLLSENSLWFNSKNREELYKEIINKTLNSIEIKKWGEKNKLLFKNIFFDGNLPKFLGFDLGTFAIKGGRATVHQGQIYKSGNRDTSFVGSFRLVTDFTTDIVYTALAGGASDRRFSKFYSNDLNNWREGKYKALNPLS
jgi:penicillin amidase